MLDARADAPWPSGAWLVWGCSGHARVLLDMIGSQGPVAAFVDEAPMPSLLPGVPVLSGRAGFLEWCQGRNRDLNWYGAAAVGRQGGHRQRILKDLHGQGIHTPLLVHPQACVSPQARIGLGSQILAMAVVASYASLGEACIVNHRASVDHECRLGDGVTMGPGATLCGCVEVGDDAFIGAGATVLPRVRIGAGAMVGAGAVVTRDVPPGTVVMGNPARAQPLSIPLRP